MLRLVLLGLMGSGKTSVAAAVATRLEATVLDNDVLLRQLTGADARTVEERHGRAWLHQRELDVLRAALQRTPPLVVTAAASVADRAEVASVLDGATAVYLRTGVDTLVARVEGDEADEDTHRPDRGDVRALLERHTEQREPRYLALADLVVATDRATPEEVADRIVAWLADRAQDPSTGPDAAGRSTPRRSTSGPGAPTG